MTTDLGFIAFRQKPTAPGDDMGALRGSLAHLVGEPFRFLRVSYGDELTLHFGDVRSGRTRRTKDLHFGAYILGVRASGWLLKSDSFVVAPLAVLLPEPHDGFQP